MFGSLLAYAAAGVTGFALLAWRFRRTPTNYGSSAWLSVFGAFRAGFFRQKGLMVGDWTGLLPVYYDGTHAITYGAAGTGKGTSVILPNLLRSRFIFLNDPGGENAAVAIKQWRRRAFAVYAINPFGMHKGKPWELPSHAFNPFDFLDPASETFSADAKLLADMMTPRSGRETGSAKYFIERALAWKHASIVHIKTAEPRERQNPGTMYDHIHLDMAGWTKLLARMKANPASQGLVRNMANDMERMKKEASEEYSGVRSTIQQDLEWLAEPKARAAVSRSDVDFFALKGLRGEKGAAISVILPLEYKETHKAIPRLAMQCAVWALQRGKLAREKVLFEIDEAASLGRIESLPQWLAELRKYRVQWSLQFQNIAQPRHLYEKEWQTFQGNAGLKRFIGVRDAETAKEVATYCGRRTIKVKSSSSGGGYSFSETGRELVMLDEALRLPEDRMIAFIDNHYPLLLKKTPYWNRPEFSGRYFRNPYHDHAIAAEFGISLQALWGRIVYLAAWWLTPSPMAALLILWVMLLWASAQFPSWVFWR